jgi:hypothetical protein
MRLNFLKIQRKKDFCKRLKSNFFDFWATIPSEIFVEASI